MSLSLKIKGIEAVGKAIKQLSVEVRRDINDEFVTFGTNVQKQAKQLCPTNESRLINSIEVVAKDLSVSVFSTVDYAAYVEFGTRKFAAAYVNQLPSDWQTYAATFKGKTGGSGDFFERILAWVKRKGIAQQSIQPIRIAKTGRVTRNRQQEDIDNEAAAYQIALSILRNGTKPHPFLYPAFRDNTKAFEQRLKAIVK